MAGERELEPAAEREAADGGDQRLGHLVLQVVDFRQIGLETRRIELADVRAAGKRLRRADDHRGLHRGVAIGFLQAFHEAGAHGVAEAVDRGIVERDDGYAVANSVLGGVGHLGDVLG